MCEKPHRHTQTLWTEGESIILQDISFTDILQFKTRQKSKVSKKHFSIKPPTSIYGFFLRK